MKSGKLPYYKIEREVRFKTKDVDDYFKKNKHPIAEVSTESKTIAEHTTDEEIIGVLRSVELITVEISLQGKCNSDHQARRKFDVVKQANIRQAKTKRLR